MASIADRPGCGQGAGANARSLRQLQLLIEDAARGAQPLRARHQLKRVALDQRIRLLGVRSGGVSRPAATLLYRRGNRD